METSQPQQTQEQKQMPPPTAFGHSPRRLFVEIGVVLGVLVAFVVWVVPWLAEKAVGAFPYSTDRALGEVASESFLSGSTTCTNPALIQSVEQVVGLLSQGLDPAFLPVRVWIVEGEDVNAFALPGGYVFVMSGLLADLRNPEELAGVIGHELGHVALRHGMTRIARQSAWSILIMWLLGGSAGTLDTLSASAVGLVALRFDRDQETESDNYGFTALERAGISPTGLADFLERLPEGPLPAWFLTHPEPAERAKQLRARPTPPLPNTSPLPPLAALQAPCHLPTP